LSESFDFFDVVSLFSVVFPNEKVDSGFETFDAAEPKVNVEAAPELFEVSKINQKDETVNQIFFREKHPFFCLVNS
jgi:hypothetical protein